jgi:DNA-binding NtrC family response regulator
MDDKCRQSLGNYHWPDNIRQLHNVIETVVLLAPSNQISLNELPEEIRTSANRESYFTVFLGSSLDEVEREFIRRTIAFADGIKPEHLKCWESPAGLSTENSSATTLDTNPTADLTGTDTAHRAMIA